jgi:hypothetical protein
LFFLLEIVSRSTSQRSTSTQSTTVDDFIAGIIDEKPVILTDRDSDNNEDEGSESLSKSKSNSDDPNYYDDPDRSSYDTDISNRVASISSILLFLMPLLLVLLF